MTPEQRRDASNGIWLCATHADLVDRDLNRFAIEALCEIKAGHERYVGELLRGGGRLPDGDTLVEIGPEIVFLGSMVGVAEGRWDFRIGSFVRGDKHALIALIGEFGKTAQGERFVLADSIGDGRVLSGTPSLERRGDGDYVLCPVAQRSARQPVQDLPLQLAVSTDTNDLFLKNRQIARVKGLESFPQHLRQVLNMQLGESAFHPNFGTRIAEYYEELRGSFWFERTLKLEVIRQSAIPYLDPTYSPHFPPIRCVDRVADIQILGDMDADGRVSVHLFLEVAGLGEWEGDVRLIVTRASRQWQTQHFAILAAPHNG